MTSSPVTTDSAAVTPTAEAPIAATCENALTPAAAADIEAAGYELYTELPGGADATMAALIGQGGLSCYWTSGGDVVAWLGQAAMDDDAWNTRRAELVAAGYTESDEPLAGTLQGERSGDAYPTLVNSGGVTYYVSQPSFLASVAALQ